MIKMIGRNIFRISLLILAAGLVMAIIYALSFTSLGEAANRREFYGLGQGAGQFDSQVDGAEFLYGENGQGFGRGQGQGLGKGPGNGYGGGRNQSQGLGSGLGQGYGENGGEEFSLERGIPELVRNLFVVAILIGIVYFLQYLAKRRQRSSPVG